MNKPEHPTGHSALVTAAGCKLNQAEGDLWKSWFASQGYEVLNGLEDSDDPEVCLVTTCTVTKAADRSSINLIRRLHRKYPKAKIKVTGCGAQRICEKMKNLPGVSEVITYSDKEELIQNILFDKTENANYISRNRAFLRVGDGCNRKCSYCIVSRVRGKLHSKPMEDIINELIMLRNKGFGEVVLVALNLGIWGNERGEKLAQLIKTIGDKQTEMPRIRLTSLEPDTVDNELLQAITESENICPHFHIPLQSGDDRILQEMQRPYISKDFANLTTKIRKQFPNACIGTDIITSTPSEDELSFKKTVDFLNNMPLDYIHAFTYSPRPGTPMFEKTKQNLSESPKKRTKTLREMSAIKNLQFRKRFEGKKRECVILAENRVLTDNYIDIAIPGTNKSPRSLNMVKIIEANRQKTRGEICE